MTVAALESDLDLQFRITAALARPMSAAAWKPFLERVMAWDLRGPCFSLLAMDWLQFLVHSAYHGIENETAVVESASWTPEEQLVLTTVTTMVDADGASPRELLLALNQLFADVNKVLDREDEEDVYSEDGSDDEGLGESKLDVSVISRPVAVRQLYLLYAVGLQLVAAVRASKALERHVDDLLAQWRRTQHHLTDVHGPARLLDVVAQRWDALTGERTKWLTAAVAGFSIGLLPAAATSAVDPLLAQAWTIDELLSSVLHSDHILYARLACRELESSSDPAAFASEHLADVLDVVAHLYQSPISTHWAHATALLTATVRALPARSLASTPAHHAVMDFLGTTWSPFLAAVCADATLRRDAWDAGSALMTRLPPNVEADVVASMVHTAPYPNLVATFISRILQVRIGSEAPGFHAAFIGTALVPTMARDVQRLVDAAGRDESDEGGPDPDGALRVAVAWLHLAFLAVQVVKDSKKSLAAAIREQVVGPLRRVQDQLPPLVHFALDEIERVSR
ncbi:hypothetical protein H9P43_001696 [Blastocladiella emersonii ATCC 22665]|nr:hypothetical protein H9P43_001696 [Blastocladiella emersonii ATCC 22665]